MPQIKITLSQIHGMALVRYPIGKTLKGNPVYDQASDTVLVNYQLPDGSESAKRRHNDPIIFETDLPYSPTRLARFTGKWVQIEYQSPSSADVLSQTSGKVLRINNDSVEISNEMGAATDEYGTDMHECHTIGISLLKSVSEVKP